MSQNNSTTRNNDQRDGEPRSINHIIWGMTAGLLLGTALGILVIGEVGVGVALAIIFGAVFTIALKGRVP